MPVDRSRLPALGPEPTFNFPEIRRRVLPTKGCNLYAVEPQGQPTDRAHDLLDDVGPTGCRFPFRKFEP